MVRKPRTIFQRFHRWTQTVYKETPTRIIKVGTKDVMKISTKKDGMYYMSAFKIRK